MSNLDDQFLLMRYSVDDNNDYIDEKMKKFEPKLDKINWIFDHRLHQNKIYSPDNDVKYDGLLEITK